MSFLLKKYWKLSSGRQFLKVYYLQDHQLQLQSLKTTSNIFNTRKPNPDATATNVPSKTAKKRKETLMITLIQNQNLTVTPLEDAKNLAKRRSMHLVKVEDLDTKAQRPVFKLLTAAEMLENELSDVKNSEKSAPASKKSEKSLNINSRIAEHDLSSRIKNICKWLNKQHEVRILIQGTSAQDLASGEKIVKTVEEAIKNPKVIGKIVQKRIKGTIIRFSVLPVTQPETDVKTASQ